MTMTIRLHGVQEALKAFAEMPKRIRRKHVSIALNAGGGIIRDRAVPLARRQSGLLAKSLSVKVPSQAKLEKEGKPAYALIGPKRKFAKTVHVATRKVRQFTKTPELRDFELTADYMAELKRQRKGVRISVRRARVVGANRAAKLALVAGQRVVLRRPSRYAHLVEKGHARGKGRSAAKAYPFMAPAVSQTKSAVIAKVTEKLKHGIETEALALAGKGA